MPSTHKTAHLNLNQWIGSDKPKREDFCDDNLKVDTAIKNHTGSTDIHITADERTAWQSGGLTISSYVGDLEPSRTITLGYKPRAVIVFLAVRPLVEYKKSADTCNIYSAICTPLGSSQGISITATGFVVKCAESSSTGGSTEALNLMNKTYIYLAWR